MGTVVVGYIPSPAGEAALTRAVLEAQQRGHRLLVINSVPGGVSDHENVVRGEARQRLDAVLAATGVEHEVRQPARGREPAEEISEAADETQADLVVIGMRKRTPVGKLIMGSAAQHILLEVSSPVLTVKADYDR